MQTISEILASSASAAEKLENLNTLERSFLSELSAARAGLAAQNVFCPSCKAWYANSQCILTKEVQRRAYTKVQSAAECCADEPLYANFSVTYLVCPREHKTEISCKMI